jgi:TRAP-type C4-dicarboxylate transport system substrate-binding protein
LILGKFLIEIRLMKLSRLATACLVLLALPQSLGANTLKFTVAGSNSATGNIQANKERPFFEALGKRTGLPLTVSYQPIDGLDMDPEEGLELVQHGIVDIASLGIAVISKRDPFFLGLDIVGLTPDYESARRVVSAFSTPIESHLRETYNAKLLGIWPFGPQVLFCRPVINGLEEIQGLKVRVYDASLGAFIETLGAIPVEIKFADVRQALTLNIVDCAITGPSSANTAGWVDETEVMLPLGFQIAFNAYAINLDRWDALSPIEQNAITDAFDLYLDDVWAYSEELYNDALRCNVGQTPCSSVEPSDLRLIAVDQVDQDLIRNSLNTISLPAWITSCERQHAGCSEIWTDTVGRAVSID